MNTAQRRQPVSYAELQEVLQTGVFPLMDEPVKAGVKPFCSNCSHWTPNTNGEQGVCGNMAAREHAPFARLDRLFGEAVRYQTGGLCWCPEHEAMTNASTDFADSAR